MTVIEKSTPTVRLSPERSFERSLTPRRSSYPRRDLRWRSAVQASGPPCPPGRPRIRREWVEKVAQALLPDEGRAIYVQRKVVGADEKAATPPDNKELRPMKTSGGGGNRTRVRRSLAEGFYMLSRCLKIRSALLPSAGAWSRASPAWISLPIPPGGEWLASPLNDALSHPAGENGKGVADLSSQCQFFVGSCGFPFVLRANGTSACHLRRNHPRRNLSPPGNER